MLQVAAVDGQFDTHKQDAMLGTLVWVATTTSPRRVASPTQRPRNHAAAGPGGTAKLFI
jgi:hypothetical protein